MRKLTLLSAVFALMIWNGCSDSDVGGRDKGGSIIVETVVLPQIVVTGQTVTVSCPVLDELGNVQDRPTNIAIDPPVALIGSQFTPTQAGHHQVTCALADGSVTDVSPAIVYVIGPDDVDKVVVDTLLSKGEAAIDEPVTASCNVAFDGAILDGIVTEVTSDPSAGITIDDHTLTGHIDSDFQIACVVPNTAFIDDTPARLVVGEGSGQPARVTTSLDKHTIAAGETAQVTCTVTTEAGKVLQLTTIVDTPPGVGITGHTLTGQQVGEHEITCRLSGETQVELLPETLTVTPGAPVSVEAWADPIKNVYKPGDQVTIVWQGIDAFENPIPAPAGKVTAPSVGLAKLDVAKYELLDDGYYTFTVTLDAGPKTDVEITVDGSGPVITINSPERGQTLDGDGQVVATGSVHDVFGGVQELKVNGFIVSVDETGNWKFNVASSHGMNALVVTAIDKHDNETSVNRGWYYSSTYITADKADPDAAWLPNTVRVWMSQEIIDDGDHTEAKVDDLAHLLELLMDNVDFGEMLGKPVLFEQVTPGVVNQPNFLGLGADLVGDMKMWAEVDQVIFGDTTLSLKSRDGGIDMDAHFIPDAEGNPGMTVQIKVYVQLTLTATAYFDIDGQIGVPVTAEILPPPTVTTTSIGLVQDIDLDTSFDISQAPGEELSVVGKELKVVSNGWDLSPLAAADVNLGTVTFFAELPFIGKIKVGEIALGTVDLTGLVSGLNGIFSALSGVILDNALDLAAAVLEPFIAVVGGDALEMALKSLEIEQTIAMPQLVDGQPAAEIDVAAKLAQVQFTAAGATLGLDGRAISNKVIDRNPLGSILRDGCLGVDNNVYALPKTGKMEFALALDLMNEVLFSFWWNGGLNMTLDANQLESASDLALNKAELTLNPLLPPILDDCNSKGTLKMQIADAHLDVDVLLGDLPITFKAWLTAEADIGIAAQDGNVGVVINGISKFELEMYDVQGPFKGNEGLLSNFIEDVLLKELLGALTDSALGSFPMPEFNIGGLVPGLGEDVKLGLDGIVIKKSAGFLQIEGQLN